MHRADGGAHQLWTFASQPLPDLRGAPTGKLALERQDRLLHDQRELIGVPVRPAAAVRQALNPIVLVAVVDLVAGLPRDPELLAERRHFLAVQHARDETQAV